MRILVVEDDPEISTFVEKGLWEAGHAVDISEDGETALDWALIVDYDVIILDVMLPIRDGFEVTRVLRSRGNRTPILLLTARDAVDDRVTGLDSGADDYLVKPFAFAELLARLRAILPFRPRSEPPRSQYRVGTGNQSMDCPRTRRIDRGQFSA